VVINPLVGIKQIYFYYPSLLKKPMLKV
jgi:hypothetical protein